jgi:hypothetical protein
MSEESIRESRAKVIEVLGKATYEEMGRWLREKNPSLWGTEQPRTFLADCMTLALYQDITGEGYHHVLNHSKIPYKMNHKSFQHNAKKIRECLAAWGETKIVLGSIDDWKGAVRNVVVPKDLEGAMLWIDSTDFPREKKAGESRKGPQWSWKLNKPGRRFMTICDGKRRIRKIWGGYSPKIHDGNWLEIFKDWFEKNLVGAGILGDDHFSWGRKKIKGVKFFTPFRKPPRPRNPRPGQGRTKLTKAQKTFNSHLTALRARVESPYGSFKTMFAALGKPFAENEQQHDYLVLIAAGVHNSHIH